MADSEDFIHNMISSIEKTIYYEIWTDINVIQSYILIFRAKIGIFYIKVIIYYA